MKAWAEVPDDELMLCFRDGDAAAFETLYDRYSDGIFGLCVNLLSDRVEAEDALQEVFVRVIDNRHRFEPRGQFRSWVYTVGRRVCLDRLRSVQRESAALQANPPELPATAQSGSSLARADLERLLSTLPPEQREVLVLHRIYGFSHGEIADMIGVSEAGVKQKAYRALKTLRSLVTEGTARE